MDVTVIRAASMGGSVEWTLVGREHVHPSGAHQKVTVTSFEQRAVPTAQTLYV